MANIGSSTTTQTLTAQYNNVANGATISVSSGAAAITNAFTVGYDPTLVSNGIIIGTGNVNGVNIMPGDNSFATKIVNDGGATIAGNNAIYLSGTLGTNVNDTAATPTSASITNAGIIKGTGPAGNQTNGSGILVGTAVHASVNNTTGAPGALGTITGTNYGILFRGLGNFGDYVTNSGSISGGFKGIVFDNITFTNGSSTGDTGFGVVNNSGIIGNATESTGIAVEFDTGVKGATVTNSGTIIGGIQAGNGGVLNVQDTTPFGSTITGVANFGSNSTLNLSGTGGIGTAANYIGFATINIASGADFALSKAGTSATFTGNSIINNSGTVLVGGALADVNGGTTSAASINMEATLGIATTIDYTGSVTSTPLYDFGGNDDIILSASALPTEGAGSSDSLAYNTVTGVLTVSETSAAGAVSTANVTISEPNAYNSTSFVGLQAADGVNIQLGSAQIIGNTGSLVLNDGETATLSNTALDNLNVTFGPNGSVAAPNALFINGPDTLQNGGSFYLSNLGSISGFGVNDIITLGTGNIAGAQATDVYTYGYNSVTGNYQIFDQSEAMRGGSQSMSTDTIIFAPAGSYAAGSFVETYGTNGINIETAATDAEQGYTFNAGNGNTANINTVLDYSGLVAPGDSIVSGEVVTIASGTATFSTATAEGSSNSFVNSGTILVSGTGSAFTDYATLTGGGTVVAANGGTVNILSSSGTDAAQTLQFGTGSPTAINTIDLNPAAGTFAGTIAGFGVNDDIVLGGSVLPAATSGSSVSESFNPATGVLTVTELNSAGTTVGVSTVTLTGDGSLTSASFVATQNSNGVNIVLSSTPLTTSAGSIYIDYGHSVTLTDTAAIDTVSVTFGTHGSIGGLNTLDINGTVAGTNLPYQGTISGFGLNDDIVVGPSTLPSVATGSAVTLSYAGSLLTVGEVNSAGTVTASTTIDVGTGYSTSSFVALLGTNGINIETPATVDEMPLTFSASGTTASFENPADYTGGLAPGSSIVAGETVIVAAGTASIASTSPVANSGTIIVSGTGSALIDPTSLTGGGTVAITNGAQFTLANPVGTDPAQTVLFGTASPAAPNTLDVNDNSGGFAGTIAGFGANDVIVLGPSVLPAATPGSSVTESFNSGTGVLTVNELNAGGSIIGTSTVTLSGEGSLSSSSFVVTQGTNGVEIALASTPLTTNAGSIYIDYGHSVTLTDTAGVDTIPVTFGTHGSVGGFNTLDINGTVAGTNSPYQGTISGFGLNDDIIIGPSTLPSLAVGSSAVTLSYAGSLLTVGEVNSGGTVTATTTLDVGTGYSVGSFVALIGTNGINIETPATVDEQGFTLQAGVPGNFENPTLYAGGLAPGSSIVAGETVTIVPASLAELTTPVTNSGVILLDGYNANLFTSAPLSGNGTVLVTGGSELVLQNGTGATTNTIAFGSTISGIPNVVEFNTPGTAGFAGTIANIGAGDDIDLGSSFLPTPTSTSNISLSFASGILTVFDTVNGTVYTDMLTIAGTVPGTFSAVLSNGGLPGGTSGIIITDVPCFAAGTRILTGDGQVAVESIKVGDKVLTVREGAEAEVVWVGSRTIDLARHAMPEKVRPVRILAGAFGEGLPERDLRLSPDHALFIDGHLIEAKTLVNGVTVIEEMATRFVTYHHVELAAHDIMLAEGLAAESYLDSGNRMMFESDAVPMMLHPDFAAVSRVKACAPLAIDGDVVVAARARLLARAVALGFLATGEVDLTAHVAGTVVTPEVAGEELLFVLPSGAESVELVSSVGVPAETSALPGDRRTLGVAITGLALVAGGKRMVISLEDPAHTGFYEMENGHRWTNGAARVALPAYTGRAVLEVTINGQAVRWVSAA